jgi:Tfp pilus assembly protein PilN
MINLLPHAEKRTLAKEYRFRAAVVFLVCVLGLEVIAVAVFAPTALIVASAEQALSADLEQRRANLPPNVESDRRELQMITQEVALLDPKLAEAIVPLSEVIERVVARRSNDIVVLGFLYDRGEKGTTTLQVRGIASDRDSLLDFQRKLKEEPIFVDAELPPGGFVKKTDIDFTIKISLARSAASEGKETSTP